MIGLDTNVLVRYLTQDDPVQAPLATRLIESLTPEAPGFVAHAVLAETVWVLESCYAADADRIAQVAETLLRVESLVVDEADVVWQALRQFKRAGGNFADALVSALARRAGCETIYSFDRGAAKRFDMTLLQ
ncbi:type II toxin-antitoxin system VapC family toxin [Salinisphaera sp.]|uniref:PIN domain-containing protein n=1 Tax=Salinisphaera sp. TaxID=1914330 RepID=UPI002D7685E0|nr:type II toxin-antitoxin system VapC family toxin [Salinisphaera sp.]HET7314040.1 type II toxin-antitoxin system VapC family toxin [Salinisphaera sp.]